MLILSLAHLWWSICLSFNFTIDKVAQCYSISDINGSVRVNRKGSVSSSVQVEGEPVHPDLPVWRRRSGWMSVSLVIRSKAFHFPQGKWSCFWVFKCSLLENNGIATEKGTLISVFEHFRFSRTETRAFMEVLLFHISYSGIRMLTALEKIKGSGS